MIVADTKGGLPDPYSVELSAHAAGPSIPPPPSFEESVRSPDAYSDFGGANDALIPHGGEEPPPAFAPYEAECTTASDGSILSHDPHLNQDGEALYRFLLSHSTAPPSYVVKCKGTHTELRVRSVSTTDKHGHARTRQETYNETVTDFDFSIDVGQHLLPPNLGSPNPLPNPHAPPPVVHWSVADEEPAFRGRMVRDIGVPPNRRKALKREVKHSRAWGKERERRGLPPWVAQENDPDALERTEYGVLKSSWTLRQWADDYCASEKKLKEFKYEKVVYGWNTAALTTAIQTAILSTRYTGSVTVSFETGASRIIVRSANRLSRALSNKWIKFLLIITLVYPFIWLFRRFHRGGGGTWAVCGGAYALKSWADVPPSEALLVDVDAPASGPGEPVSARRLVKTSAGVKALVGTREGEWFKQWEPTIRSAVLARRTERVPLRVPDERGWNAPAMLLDGYM